ncbi:hypothetical protein ALNOE001_01200 [Candidatus Methanobinarius endosymbioticus]|uniref:Acid-resistance membrane protein n=1 Tax=Candidatus Methanobinarius endosymbioticus TaxID=2006182 RepID=A0A366MF82_9EURY|nr:hypothetical protein ALNOE001_01200 [Candidatus Methanobinarius endosymbioticus]
MGILALLFGIFVILFPFVSASFFKIASGIAISILGIYWLIRGIQHWETNKAIWVLYSIIGIFAMFADIAIEESCSFFLLTSSFLLYVIGFLMIVFGVAAIINGPTVRYKLFSTVFVVFGLVISVFANLVLDNPYYLSILVGIALIAEAINLLFESGENKVEPVTS